MKVVNFSALFSLCTSTPAVSMQPCEIEMNEVLRFITQRCCLCERGFDLHVRQTYGKQMSLFVTQGDSLSPFPPPPSVFTILSPPLPPSLAPCLPTSFLPRRSLSASQHIPRAGSLIRASSTLPLSFLPLSPARSLRFLSAARSLSIRHSRTEAVSITYRQVQVQR